MLYYSKAALRYAFDRCLERERYKVGIATSHRHQAANILLDMIKNISPSEVQVLLLTKHNPCVRFSNGSEISFIPQNESARGRKLHLLIVDEDVESQFLQCVLRPMEILEYMERSERK